MFCCLFSACLYHIIIQCSGIIAASCDNSTEKLLSFGYEESVFDTCQQKYEQLKENIDKCIEDAARNGRQTF